MTSDPAGRSRCPRDRRWLEVFDSDVDDRLVNPIVASHGGSTDATGGPLHGYSTSSEIGIPANGVAAFARDPGD